MRILFSLFVMMAMAQAGQLRIVSYNIHHGRGMDGKLDLKRIADVIRKTKPDLVALQEVDINVTRSGKVDTVKELAKMLGMHHAFGKTIDLQGGEYGNAVLSKFPIDQTSVYKLPSEGEARAILRVDVKVKGKPFSFCSIHFDHQNGKIRQLQAKAMTEFLQNVKHSVIVAGDFNAPPNSATMKLVEEFWFVIPKQGDRSTVPADKPTQEIDYIITRNLPKAGAVSRVIQERVASDHRPVLGFISISE